MEDIGTDEKMILNHTSEKCGVRMWITFICAISEVLTMVTIKITIF
jgi:hypothetical protein